MIMEQFLDKLTPEQRALFTSLDSPAKIQAFLNNTPYSPENADRCPVSVLRDHLAHCLDGGLFAAAALRQIGFPPVLIDILPEPETDDDHVLAIYQVGGYYGCLAKSNYVGLRSRDPVYRTFRELVLSYFENYFNPYHEKTLRGYTVPLHLDRYDSLDWMGSDKGAEAIERLFKKQRKVNLVTPQMVPHLIPADDLAYQAGTLATNPNGVYQPKRRVGSAL